MKRNRFLLAAIASFIPTFVGAEDHREVAPPFEPALPWLTDLDIALDQSRKTGKPILAEFR